MPGPPPVSAVWWMEMKPAGTWVLIEKLWKEKKAMKRVKLHDTGGWGKDVNICGCI